MMQAASRPFASSGDGTGRRREMMATPVSDAHRVSSIAQLEALYADPSEPSLAKEIDHISTNYRKLIEASPFLVLATNGPEGLDCSPRGDPPGFVRVLDEKTLLIPDRRGNNRIDSLRNIVRDPRVALLLLIPGVGETMRVIGRAAISTDTELRASFVMNGKTPGCVIVVEAERVYFQCTKAIVRAKLWDPTRHVERGSLPTAGMILNEITEGRLGGEAYDRAAPDRVKATIY
jgi:PPOX class probable FMN-dependent enzyme